jgi:hypothetical protein
VSLALLEAEVWKSRRRAARFKRTLAKRKAWLQCRLAHSVG